MHSCASSYLVYITVLYQDLHNTVLHGDIFDSKFSNSSIFRHCCFSHCGVDRYHDYNFNMPSVGVLLGSKYSWRVLRKHELLLVGYWTSQYFHWSIHFIPSYTNALEASNPKNHESSIIRYLWSWFIVSIYHCVLIVELAVYHSNFQKCEPNRCHTLEIPPWNRLDRGCNVDYLWSDYLEFPRGNNWYHHRLSPYSCPYIPEISSWKEQEKRLIVEDQLRQSE